VSTYDYYTGGPDLSPAGAPSTLAGYGPNTRTIMQVKVGSGAPTVAFDRPNTTSDRLGSLAAAFAHHLDASGKPAGVFEKGQNPVIVGQAAYNSAYGTNFVSSGFCSSPKAPSVKCDGFARIQQQGGQEFKFDTLSGKQLGVKIEPKAIHDEVNSSTFDEYGRMSANLGLEAPGNTPLTQQITLFPYVNPVTEILDADSMPSSLHVTPISSGTEGTQIWKITHNGVDTHPIHFHLFDVQLINRVTWDGIIMPPEATELGWKDTVRISPLEDTIVAVRPIVPVLPFNIPDSRRPLNPMMPIGARGTTAGPTGTQAGFNNSNAVGAGIDPIVNEVVNLGWEYVYHCHILSHEEMDMMRPVSVHVTSVPPVAPASLSATRAANATRVLSLRWVDGTAVDYSAPSTWGDRRNEIGYRIERAPLVNNRPGAFTQVGTALANATSFTDTSADPGTTYVYRVTAWNEGGSSASDTLTVPGVRLARVVLAANTARSTKGTNVRFSVTVLPSSGTGVATGTVTLTASNPNTASPLVITANLVRGGANIDTAMLAGGQNTVVATYSGDATFLDAVSPSITVQVAPRATATSLLTNVNPAMSGAPITYTALVSGGSLGTVTFFVDGVPGAPVPLVSGRATTVVSTLAVGTHTVRAVYSGSFNALASSSGTLNQTVARAVTKTTLVASPVSASAGSNVTFTATVAVVAPGAGTPAGTVLFRGDNGVVLATGVPLNSNGQAVFSTTSLAKGIRQVVAVYSGSSTHNTSTSPTIAVTIR
jgi:hypothetical protein